MPQIIANSGSYDVESDDGVLLIALFQMNNETSTVRSLELFQQVSDMCQPSYETDDKKVTAISAVQLATTGLIRLGDARKAMNFHDILKEKSEMLKKTGGTEIAAEIDSLVDVIPFHYKPS